MNVDEGKKKFIEHWGKMGSDWGVNRCMAQIHALLLVSHEPLDTDEIMDELCISRGSVNMNLRALIDWGLVEKKLISGERKQYFEAEKDIWKAFRQIIINRKKRELDPLKQILNELENVDGETEEADEFKSVIRDLSEYTDQSEQALDMILKMKHNWLRNPLFKMMS